VYTALGGHHPPLNAQVHTTYEGAHNGLKCFFWKFGDFFPYIFFECLLVCRASTVHFFQITPQKKKRSGAVRSGVRWGHGTSPKREIARCGNKQRSAAMQITAVWAVEYLNLNTAYIQIPALRDTLAEKHVTKILKCFAISVARTHTHTHTYIYI